MSSMISYFSILDEIDLIDISHGLEAMSDDDDRLPLEEAIQCCSDLGFTLRIQGGRRFIEEDDIWIFEKDFRDRESLFLSS